MDFEAAPFREWNMPAERLEIQTCGPKIARARAGAK